MQMVVQPSTYAKTHKPMSNEDAEGWSPQDHSPTITYWPRDRSDAGTDVAVVQPGPLDTDGHTVGVCVPGDRTHALTTVREASPSIKVGTGGAGNGGDGVIPIDLRQAARGERDTNARTTGGAPGTGVGDAGDPAYTVSARQQAVAAPVVATTMSVRRLTPVECERLQGFPDGHTAIPWKGKPPSECPDGPRYRALGNSMAVPVIRWIARKIEGAMP